MRCFGESTAKTTTTTLKKLNPLFNDKIKLLLAFLTKHRWIIKSFFPLPKPKLLPKQRLNSRIIICNVQNIVRIIVILNLLFYFTKQPFVMSLIHILFISYL